MTEQGGTGIRIGDDERERGAARLAAEVGTGRLDLAEYERRVDRVYAARTRRELDAVFADLPTRQAAQPAPVRARRVPPAPLVAAWVPWIVVNAICLVVWVATSLGAGHPLPFWPIWVAGPWGAMLLLGTLSGRQVCGSRPSGSRH
ncbi:DUF1707 domain-containing protein [Pseudonocardia halophobica]|uniref:DUF1707 domain-containing protein n=1 Tax=Pseudonocardia halophobica TaxID=29401 RepID=A0A9W6L8J1_9PSEU|nr:DUF1707 domain-containing protein [Pseudonocardia halophobica]GLL14988.1 hypothetical protein GCM10017577_61370 [Pseudonocardia halophobica]